MLPDQTIIDALGVAVVVIRIAILIPLAFFIAHYIKLKREDRRLKYVQHIVLSFVAALSAMVLQSLTFRVMTLLESRLSPLNSAIFVLTIAVIVFVLLSYAYMQYRQLLIYLAKQGQSPTV